MNNTGHLHEIASLKHSKVKMRLLIEGMKYTKYRACFEEK